MPGKRMILVVILLILSTSLVACSGQNSDLVIVSSRGNNDDIAIIGSLRGYSPDLPSLVDYADVIIIGQVINQYPFGDYSVMTEVKVGRNIKGLNQDTIEIIQLKDGYELTVGENYLLALVSQRPDYEEDYYAVCASGQGSFWQAGNAIKVFDSTFVSDIKQFIKADRKTSLSLDELADWFETLIK